MLSGPKRLLSHFARGPGAHQRSLAWGSRKSGFRLIENKCSNLWFGDLTPWFLQRAKGKSFEWTSQEKPKDTPSILRCVCPLFGGGFLGNPLPNPPLGSICGAKNWPLTTTHITHLPKWMLTSKMAGQFLLPCEGERPMSLPPSRNSPRSSSSWTDFRDIDFIPAEQSRLTAELYAGEGVDLEDPELSPARQESWPEGFSSDGSWQTLFLSVFFVLGGGWRGVSVFLFLLLGFFVGSDISFFGGGQEEPPLALRFHAAWRVRFPPVLLEYAGAEVFRSQIERLCRVLKRSGVEVVAHCEEHQVHVYPILDFFAPDPVMSEGFFARLEQFVKLRNGS